MNEQQFRQMLVRSRQLSDANQNNTAEQWLIWAPLWQDSAMLKRASGDLEATYQKLKKWAGAGAVVAAGVFDRDCDKPQEFLYQLSLFDREEWERIAEVAILADLTPTQLTTLRTLRDNLRETNTHWCPCCEHGQFKEWLTDTTGEVGYETTVGAEEDLA